MRSYPHILDRQARLTATGVVAGIAVLFAVAVCLEPSVQGYGTHQQLGLPECQFLRLTGWKCPQCGMTTSFAHIVRGEALEAWQANPCGPVLAIVLSVVVLPWSVVAGLTGRSLLTRQPGLVMLWLAGCYLVGTTAVWVIRFAVL